MSSNVFFHGAMLGGVHGGSVSYCNSSPSFTVSVRTEKDAEKGKYGKDSAVTFSFVSVGCLRDGRHALSSGCIQMSLCQPENI